MRKLIPSLLFIFSIVTVLAQNKMRTVDELINTNQSGWTPVKQMIDQAANKVEILPCDTNKAKEALYKTQVTNRSPMGAIVYSTGGLLIDNGWIRILGSGNIRLNRSLPDWNKGKSFNNFGERPLFLLIADDAVGGFFALNGGQFGNDAGKVYYLSPESLEWEPLDLTYTEFLNFCLNGNLASFYKNVRWTNWIQDVSKLGGNEGFNFYPFYGPRKGKTLTRIPEKRFLLKNSTN
jgi:hypothetical protein